MLSILIQLNPGYLLGKMEKGPLVSQGTAEGVRRGWEPRVELAAAQARESASQPPGGWRGAGHGMAAGGHFPGTAASGRLGAVWV